MQLLAKFKKILYMEFSATLNFRKFKVALNPMYRIFSFFVSGWVTLLPGTELRPVSLNKRQQNENHFSRNIHGVSMFPQCFPVFHTGDIVSSVSFCFQDANYAYATRWGILTKLPACEHE